MTIKELRDKGCRVRVHHLRRTLLLDGSVEDCSREEAERFGISSSFSESIFPRGGKTLVEVTLPTGETEKLIALCHPNDNYCRKEGVKVALSKSTKI